MANVLLLHPLYEQPSVLYTPSWSGGSWEATLPLSNAGDRRLHKVARSTNDDLTSTIAKLDLGVARSIRGVVLVGHNLSTAAKARVRLFAAAPFYEASDFDAWTNGGTPDATTGQTDPLGGTRAVLLEDNDGAAGENKRKDVTFTGDGTKSIAISVKEGTSSVADIRVQDESAGPAIRHSVRVTWTAGVPSAATASGSGTVYSPIALGGGWYLIQFTATGVVAANTNSIRVFPSSSTVANTGTTYFYEAMAFDYDGQPIVEDSGVDDAWPSGLDLEEADGINVPYVHILSSATSARYVRVELADTANTDGYVELGRLIVAGGYQPTINFERGVRLGLESDTTRQVTDGGAAVYQEKPVRRSLTFTLPDLSESEGFLTALRMQRRLNKYGQVYVCFADDDTAEYMAERSFLGVPRELTGLDLPYSLYSRNRVAFQIVEEL